MAAYSFANILPPRLSRASAPISATRCFPHIAALSHAEIDTFGTPSLITRITNDVNQLQVAVAMLIRLVDPRAFLVIGATVMAMMIDLQMSLIFIVAAVGIAAVLYLIMSRSVPFYRAIKSCSTESRWSRGKTFAGVRVIRAFPSRKKSRSVSMRRRMS